MTIVTTAWMKLHRKAELVQSQGLVELDHSHIGPISGLILAIHSSQMMTKSHVENQHDTDGLFIPTSTNRVGAMMCLIIEHLMTCNGGLMDVRVITLRFHTFGAWVGTAIADARYGNRFHTNRIDWWGHLRWNERSFRIIPKSVFVSYRVIHGEMLDLTQSQVQKVDCRIQVVDLDPVRSLIVQLQDPSHGIDAEGMRHSMMYSFVNGQARLESEEKELVDLLSFSKSLCLLNGSIQSHFFG